jgi:hypothetical protein
VNAEPAGEAHGYVPQVKGGARGSWIVRLAAWDEVLGFLDYGADYFMDKRA